MKAKKYTQKDKFHIVYWTSDATPTPNLSHKEIARKLKRKPTGITQKLGKMRASGEYGEILNVIMEQGWNPQRQPPNTSALNKRDEEQLELPLDEPKVEYEPAKIYWSEIDPEPEMNVLLACAIALGAVFAFVVAVQLF